MGGEAHEPTAFLWGCFRCRVPELRECLGEACEAREFLSRPSLDGVGEGLTRARLLDSGDVRPYGCIGRREGNCCTWWAVALFDTASLSAICRSCSY